MLKEQVFHWSIKLIISSLRVNKIIEAYENNPTLRLLNMSFITTHLICLTPTGIPIVLIIDIP